MSLTVLVVEDDDLMRNGLSYAVGSTVGWTAIPASSSAEALRISRTTRPDVALLDVHLGRGPSGLDVALMLRKYDPQIGIVFLTTLEDPRLISSNAQIPRDSQYVLKRDVSDVPQLRSIIENALAPRSGKSPSSAVQSTNTLSNSQLATLRLLAEGLSNSEIAIRRNVTEKSVEAMITRIAKLYHLEKSPAVNHRVQLARKYFELTGSLSNGASE